MEHPRVEISRDELHTALAVWIRTKVPRHVWERYAKLMVKRLEKRDTEEDQIDPRDELAKAIAQGFVDAKWEVTHRPPKTAFEAAPIRDAEGRVIG